MVKGMENQIQISGEALQAYVASLDPALRTLHPNCRCVHIPVLPVSNYIPVSKRGLRWKMKNMFSRLFRWLGDG